MSALSPLLCVMAAPSARTRLLTVMWTFPPWRALRMIARSYAALRRMDSNSRLNVKVRTIDTAVKMAPIRRLSRTDTCSSSIGKSVICVSTATRKPTPTFVIASTNDIARDCPDVIQNPDRPAAHILRRLDVLGAKRASIRHGAMCESLARLRMARTSSVATVASHTMHRLPPGTVRDADQAIQQRELRLIGSREVVRVRQAPASEVLLRHRMS